jgi:HD superfamily phosphohydrolase
MQKFGMSGIDTDGKPTDKQFWCHEKASTMMLKYIIDTDRTGLLSEEISSDDVKFICDLILGDKGTSKRPWMFEIVSNPRNGIDVDKFDYMERDAQKTGVGHLAYDKHVLMRGARVLNSNEICYPESKDFEVKKLFDTRYNLYRDCYNHRVTQSFECLIIDILNETNGKLYDFLEVVEDPELFTELDDSIL